MEIVLGSSSATRRKVLKGAGFVFRVIAPEVDEEAIQRNNPKELTLALANIKAAAVVSKLTVPGLVIAADQVVVCHGEVRGKPKNADEARRYLESYRSYPAENVNGVVVVNMETGRRAQGTHVAKVTFKSLPQEFIESFIVSSQAFAHAGGFTVENDEFKPYIESIEGGWDSVMGMPLGLLRELIQQVEGNGAVGIWNK